MNSLHLIAEAGGLFSVFVFVHFFVDWIFQTHSEAMVKHNNALVRAKHCFIYTIGFVPLIFFLNFEMWEWILSLNILFWSHFYLDTYHGVYLWAKYIRKPPEMTSPYKITNSDGYITVLPPDPKRGFVEFISTTLGKILMIVIDQISHLVFIVPIIWMAFN